MSLHRAGDCTNSGERSLMLESQMNCISDQYSSTQFRTGAGAQQEHKELRDVS
jgi:hypothetical protein